MVQYVDILQLAYTLFVHILPLYESAWYKRLTCDPTEYVSSFLTHLAVGA